MERSESIKELAAALAKAQGEIKPAVKDKTNPAFSGRVYRYADLAGIWDACRSALSSNGLSVVQMPVDSEPGRVALVTTLLHTSGEYLSATFSAPAITDRVNGVQAIGSALTYLRRYALAAMVGVVADEDDDGQSAGSQQQQRPAQQRQQQPRTTPTPTNGDGARGATEKQLGFLKGLYRKAGYDDEQWAAMLIEQGYPTHNNLTSQDASALIEWLQKPAADDPHF